MIKYKKYNNVNELKIGMEIHDRSQLDNIYDMWVIMYKKPGDTMYTIGFIGKETNDESAKLYNKGYRICPVYNDSMEARGEMYYEE